MKWVENWKLEIGTLKGGKESVKWWGAGIGWSRHPNVGIGESI